MSVYYRHSGRIGPWGLPALILAGALGALLAGGALAGLEQLIGAFAYAGRGGMSGRLLDVCIFLLRLVVPFFLAAGLGWLTGMAGVSTRVRNLPLVLVNGFATAVGCLYVFSSVRLGLAQGEGLFLYPLSDLFAAIFPAEESTAGPFTSMLWMSQASILLIAVLATATNKITEFAFDEVNGQWARQKQAFGPFEPIPNPESFRRTLERGDFSPLLTLQKIPADSAPIHTEIELILAPGNPAFPLVSVKNVSRSASGSGKIRETATRVVEKLQRTPALDPFIRELMPIDPRSAPGG
jgi:hypothetical protein